MKATSGGRAATSTAPLRGSSRRGPKSGASSPASIRCVEAGEAAAAQLRARAPVGERAVEQDRQARAAELLAGDERRGAGRAAPRVVEEDDRRHVERADVRVAAARLAQVDQPATGAGAGDERADDLLRVAGERVHAAVMVGIGVDVEQPRAGRAERLADRGDDGRVASLGDVRDRQQERRVVPYERSATVRHQR